MNEQLFRQLSEQAHTFAVSIYEKRLETENASNVFFYKIKDTKFAQLIVYEMLKTCEEHPGWYGRDIGKQIKQHFGVES